MSWSSPFYRHTPDTREHFGYKFEWTPEHLSLEECKPLRYSYDSLADEAFKRLEAIAPAQTTGELPRNVSRSSSTASRMSDDGVRSRSPAPNASSIPRSSRSLRRDESPVPLIMNNPACPLMPKKDLYALLRDNAATDPVLGKLWDQVNTVPDWVDWDQIARGQDVFYRYGCANLTGLAYQSLLGGMGAARVVEVLARTGGFSVKVARGRLFETTQHILQCTRSLASIQPGGEGFASTIRVRFLHAAVRRRILQLAASRPHYYSIAEHGVPVNDLDCAATISVFSATLIWSSLPRQGVWMRQQEIVDYVALWRYIAWIIGSPDSYFATPEKAKAFMESQYFHEVNPTKTSALMANNIIKCLENQPPGHASAEFLTASARWLNGSELSDALELKKPSFYYTLLMIGQCILFASVCYINRSVPAWDRANVAFSKRMFWQVVVESKYGLSGDMASFDFKYVPEYDTVTDMTKDNEAEIVSKSETEMRNLRILAVTVACLLLSAWAGARAVKALVASVL